MSAQETHFTLIISPGHFCKVPFLLLLQELPRIHGTEENPSLYSKLFQHFMNVY